MFSCSFFSVIAHITVIKQQSNSKANGFGRKTTLNFGEDLFFFFGDHLISGGKITLNFGEDLFGDHLIFGWKITLNFGEDLFFFFLEITWFRAEKSFEFPILAQNSLSISVKTAEFLRVWAPPIKNPGYAYGPSPSTSSFQNKTFYSMQHSRSYCISPVVLLAEQLFLFCPKVNLN